VVFDLGQGEITETRWPERRPATARNLCAHASFHYVHTGGTVVRDARPDPGELAMLADTPDSR
jgi:hypothetical protein